MIAGKRVLVIMPAWNEAKAIAEVIQELRTEQPGVDVLVVDDGSRDATATQAAGAGAHVLRLPYNLGVGGAMRLGYRYAYDGDYDVAIQVDADGQHDPRFIPELVTALDNADMVIGARFAGVGNYTARGARRLAMVLLAKVLSRATRSPLTDVTSGFRATNRRVITIFARNYPVEYLGDTVETLLHLARLRLRVIQVPVAMRKRMAGNPSQSSAKAFLYLTRAGVVLGLGLIRRYEPEPVTPRPAAAHRAEV